MEREKQQRTIAIGVDIALNAVSSSGSLSVHHHLRTGSCVVYCGSTIYIRQAFKKQQLGLSWLRSRVKLPVKKTSCALDHSNLRIDEDEYRVVTT